MKLPWVSRAEYERVQRLYAEENKAYCAESTKAFSAECRAIDANARSADLEGRLLATSETVVQLREQKARATVVIEHLTAERDALKVDVANLTTALDALRPPATPKRSKLTQAIRDNARGPDGQIDRRLVNHFRGQANVLLNRGEKEADVIESLSQWQTTENADQITADKIADLADADVV